MKTKTEKNRPSKNTRDKLIFLASLFSIIGLTIVSTTDVVPLNTPVEVNTSIPQTNIVQISQKDIDKQIIAKDIVCVNPKIPNKEARKWANKIVNDAYEHHYSPFIQAKLIESEGGWERNPKHIMSCDKGMTGTNVRVWGDELKRAGIIKNIKDLENPIVSIAASTYIYTYYLDKYNNKTFHALAGYKGYCKVGKERARTVITMAQKLKRERNS